MVVGTFTATAVVQGKTRELAIKYVGLQGNNGFHEIIMSPISGFKNAGMDLWRQSSRIGMIDFSMHHLRPSANQLYQLTDWRRQLEN